MIKSKGEYLEYIKADMHALRCDVDPPRYGGIRYCIYRYERLLRKNEYYLNCKNKLFYKPYIMFLRLRFRKQSIKYGFEIPLNCFGKGLSIAHIGPIIINGNVKIGENCRIHVGVNIGTAAGYADKTPILGNNIYIAPGVKIFGDIKIADNVVIGANAVVNKNIETSSVTIAGVPAKIIKYSGTDDLSTEE